MLVSYLLHLVVLAIFRVGAPLLFLLLVLLLMDALQRSRSGR